MKAKTKKRLQQWGIWAALVVFIIGTILIYLPIVPSGQSSPPPLNDLPQAQTNNIPPAVPPAEPAGPGSSTSQGSESGGQNAAPAAGNSSAAGNLQGAGGSLNQ